MEDLTIKDVEQDVATYLNTQLGDKEIKAALDEAAAYAAKKASMLRFHAKHYETIAERMQKS